MKTILDPEVCWRVLLTLGHFLWQGAAIALAAAAVAWLLRRASARARYGVWATALLLMTLCPVGTFAYFSAEVRMPAAIPLASDPPTGGVPMPAARSLSQNDAGPALPYRADWKRFAPHAMTAYLLAGTPSDDPTGTWRAPVDNHPQPVESLLPTDQIHDIAAGPMMIGDGTPDVARENLAVNGGFNRVTGGPATDRGMQISLFCYQGEHAGNFDNYEHGRHLTVASARVDTDSDVSTRERATTEVRVPAAADYVLVDLVAIENVRNDLTGPEFDGHYADDVSVHVLIDE